MTIGWFPQALETLYKDPDFAPLNPKKLGLMVLLVIVSFFCSHFIYWHNGQCTSVAIMDF